MRHMTSRVVASAVLSGIVMGLFIDWSLSNPYIDVVHAQETIEEPQEVRIQVVIDWTPERIEKEIRDTFPESPDIAVRIAKCESGLKMIQSNHVANGKREESFGIMQIHSPSWETKAHQLGLGDYRTDIQQNIKMARFIFDNAGKKWTDWSCFTKKMI